jgi:hypothetical protein
MALSRPAPLADADKLNALRRLDRFREWRSLDDERYCLVCGKIITGRQIQVADSTSGNGAPGVSCPTEECNSIPMDWALPTDEILAVANAAASKGHIVIPPTVADQGAARGRTSQLSKFALQFKQAS